MKFKTGSGNIFEDLGLENPDELLVKAELARRISGIITSQNTTQAEATEILGIDQPKVSALINGKLSNFSTIRLFRFLNALGRDVEIVVKPKSLPKSSNASNCLITYSELCCTIGVVINRNFNKNNQVLIVLEVFAVSVPPLREKKTVRQFFFINPSRHIFDQNNLTIQVQGIGNQLFQLGFLAILLSLRAYFLCVKSLFHLSD